MADLEPRRSGRATKGQHKGLDEEEPTTPVPAKNKGGKKGKKGKGKSTKAEPEEEEEFVRCVCGATQEEEDDEGVQWVACDNCHAWQHQDCMQVREDEVDNDYFCEQCKPANHKKLLEAMARGERPWEQLERLAVPVPDPKDKKGKKKGAKGGANAKARLSEVSSVKGEEVGTPKPSKSSTKETPVPSAKAATPATANGSSRKASTPKLETPAPSKRKRASDVKDNGPIEKRRKSEVKAETTVSHSISSLPGPRQALIKGLYSIIQKQVEELANSRRINLPADVTEVTFAEGIALQIDDALVTQQGDLEGKESSYFKQWQSLKFNMNSNIDILYKLITRQYQPEDLAKMSSDDMLDEERKKEDAALREAAEKQSVMIHDEGPRIRKTHKGDEYIGGDEVQRQKSPLPPPIHRETEDVDGGATETPATEQSTVDRKPLTVDTGATPKSPRAARQSSGTFDINSVYNKIGSPNDASRRPSEAFRRQSSAVTPATPAPQTKDEEIDRMLQDDETSPTDFSKNPDIKWVGHVIMSPIVNYHACGRHIAGADLGQKVDWKQLIPDVPEIRGRIDPARANEYIASLRDSETIDISVINLTPVDEEAYQQKEKVCEYFLQRDRWGVIHNASRDKDPNTTVRDIYVVPVKGDSLHLPVFMDQLEHCTISAPTDETLLLLCIIARTSTPTASADATPMDAPSATPVTSVRSGGPLPTPQFSPMVNQTPTAPVSYGTPTPAPSAHTGVVGSILAMNILGNLITTPVAQNILTTNPSPEEHMLKNLREIMVLHPETQHDMSKLMEHLTTHNAGP